MTDNTQVNNGSGDVIRDIDRGTAKTQVVQIDAGGQSAESLVSQANPLPVGPNAVQAFAGGIPVDDANLNAAQSSDQPLFVAVAGDPNGDFAGVNILEKLVDDSGDLSLAVKVLNPPKQDARGAQMVSDAPSPISLVGSAGQFLSIDTTGYQTVHITSPSTGGMGGTIGWSNDGVSFSATNGVLLVGGIPSFASSISSGSNYIFPVSGKIMRISVTLAGSALLYFRSSPLLAGAVTALNLTQLAGTAIANGGATGSLGIGGVNAQQAAPTQNPLIVAGVDSGTPGLVVGGIKGAIALRQLLTDNQGRLRLAEEGVQSTIQNTPALNVQDTSQTDGQSRDEMLSQILLEMRINNQMLAELPNRLYAAFQALQTAPTSQSAFTGSASDEPQAYRNDSSVFN